MFQNQVKRAPDGAEGTPPGAQKKGTEKQGEERLEQHLRNFFKKEREQAGDEHKPSDEEWKRIQERRKGADPKLPPKDEKR